MKFPLVRLIAEFEYPARAGPGRALQDPACVDIPFITYFFRYGELHDPYSVLIVPTRLPSRSMATQVPVTFIAGRYHEFVGGLRLAVRVPDALGLA